MSLSKEQKTLILEQLNSPFTTVRLLCDGHEIALKLVRHKMKLVVSIYVDGTVKAIWSMEHEKHPESKFLAPHFIHCYKPKQREKLIKAWGKRRAYKEYPDLDEKREYRLPYFSSATRALNHLIKVSESIELVTEMAA